MVMLNAGCGDDFRGDIRIDKAQTKATTMVANLESIPLPDNYVDETICISVLEHTNNPVQAVKELCRVTKRKITIEVPVKTRQGFLSNIMRAFIPTKGNINIIITLKRRRTEDLWQFKPDSVSQLLEKNGFKRTFTRRVFKWYAGSISSCYRTIGIRDNMAHMKNILFVYPTEKRLFEQPPLGLMYLSSIAKKRGWAATLIEGDGKRIENEMCVQKDCGLKPNIIAVTSMTPHMWVAKRAMAVARGLWSSALIAIGGPHATIMPQTFEKDADVIVIGEGERAFDGLLAGYENGISLPKTMSALPIEDLDTVPFPDRTILNPKYFAGHRTTLIASRGCSFNCSFCQPTLRKIFGSKVRWRSPGNVVKEMVECESNYKIRHFDFMDDTFTANKKWAKEFCSLKMASSLKSDFVILTRVNVVDEEVLKMLKDAGMIKICFGLESGSQKILDSLNKGVKVEQIKEAFAMCRKLHIKTHAFLMIGSIGETEETLEETRKLVKEVKPDTIYASITTPLPETYMYYQCVKEGRVNPEDVLKEMDYYRNPIMKVDGFSPEQIVKIRTDMLRNFMMRKLLNPVITIRHVKKNGWRSTLELAKNLFRGD